MLTVSQQPLLLEWASRQIHGAGPAQWGHDARALGVIERATGRIVFVLVVNAFYDDSCTAHQASDCGKAWATPAVLRGIFSYIFDYLKVQRLVVMTPAENTDAVAAVVKMGFTIEGRVRTSWDGKKAEILATMFRPECRWLTRNEEDHGQEEQTPGA